MLLIPIYEFFRTLTQLRRYGIIISDSEIQYIDSHI